MENLSNSLKVSVVLYKLNIDQFKKSGQITFFNKNKTDDVSTLYFKCKIYICYNLFNNNYQYLFKLHSLRYESMKKITKKKYGNVSART